MYFSITLPLMPRFPPTYCCWKIYFTDVDPQGHFQPHILRFCNVFCLDSLLREMVFLSRCEQSRTKPAVIRPCQIQPECSGPWRAQTLPVQLAKHPELHSTISCCSLHLKAEARIKGKIFEYFETWVGISPLSVEHPASEICSSITANAEKCLSRCLRLWIHLQKATLVPLPARENNRLDVCLHHLRSQLVRLQRYYPGVCSSADLGKGLISFDLHGSFLVNDLSSLKLDTENNPVWTA